MTMAETLNAVLDLGSGLEIAEKLQPLKPSKLSTETIEIVAAGGWLIIDKSLLDNKNLSFAAKGMLCCILTKPDNWHTDPDVLKKCSKSSIARVYTILDELEKNGYCQRYTVYDKQSKVPRRMSVASEVPIDTAKASVATTSSDCEACCSDCEARCEARGFGMILRTEKISGNFVIIDKVFLEDANLSWRAKGILCLISKSPGWNPNAGELSQYSAESESATGRGLEELAKCGYYQKYPRKFLFLDSYGNTSKE